MHSLDTVVAAAAAAKGGEPAATLAGAGTPGCGPFCTGPGGRMAFDGAPAMAHALPGVRADAKPHPMSAPGMRAHVDAGVARVAGLPGVTAPPASPAGDGGNAAQQHRGPFPSSAAPRTTPGGLAAPDRFPRPVAPQDAPARLRR